MVVPLSPTCCPSNLPLFRTRAWRKNVGVSTATSPSAYRTSRERFCEKFTCDSTSFEHRALLESLDPLPRLFARFIAALNPSALDTDRKIIRRVSHMDTVPDVLRAVQDLEKEYVAQEDFGPLRTFLKVKLSRKRLLKVTARIWDRPPNFAMVLSQ